MKAEGILTKNSLASTLIVAIVILIAICNLSIAQFTVAEENQSVDCTTCHSITMERHRFPTSTCKSCHGSNMVTLTLKDGKVIPIEESDPLCAQCHKEIFQAWMEGKHGTADSKCVACHDPHFEDKTSQKIEVTSPISRLLQIIAVAGLFIGAAFLALMQDHL